MSDFKDKICAIKRSIANSDHRGCERCLQLAILGALRKDNCNLIFSENGNINNNIKGWNCGYGRELGWGNLQNVRNRFIDLSLARLGKNAKNNNIKEIINLCEVKIISPKHGAWSVFYGTGTPCKNNCNCQNDCYLQKINGENVVTFFNEGQIIFDFIKMMAIRHEAYCPDAELYQILAVKKTDNVENFENCKIRLIKILEDWKKHVNVNEGSTIEIYEKNKKLAFGCQLIRPLSCRIEDLGIDSSGEYLHVLIDWQNAQNADFCLP